MIAAGETVEYRYLAPANFDAAAVANARAAEIDAGLVEQEADGNIERDGAPVLAEQTMAGFLQRFRLRHRVAEGVRLCYLAWWLLRRIAAGHITDAQCRAAFGMTTTAWTTFKTAKLQPRADAWNTILAALGD